MNFSKRSPFEFIGRLEILKNRVLSNGNEVKGTFQTNDKGTFERLVFGTKLEKQGNLRVEVTSFNNPVTFTLKEVDSKGVAKKFNYSGGKPLTESQRENITDIFKSQYFIKGKSVNEFNHSKDYVAFIKNNIVKLIEKDTYFRVTGYLEKSAYNDSIIEKYVFNNIEVLNTKPVKEYLQVYETFTYKKGDVKDTSIGLLEYFRVATKSGYQDVWYKSEKIMKLDPNFLFEGSFDSYTLEENIILQSYLEQMKQFNRGIVRLGYYPVIKSTETKDISKDISELSKPYQLMYQSLIDKGLKEKAEQLLKSASKSIQVAEGGNPRSYYLNEFCFTDGNMNIIETSFDNEFNESTVKLINEAMKKENKGKKTLESICINKKTRVEISEEVFGEDNNEFGDFNDSLKDNEFLNSVNEVEEQLDNKVKEVTKEANTEKEEFNFDTEQDKSEETKKEIPKKEEIKKEKVENVEDLDDEFEDFPF